MDRALDIERASLLNFAFIYLALDWLRNVEEAVLALEKLDVVQYRVIVLQRDLGIHRHHLNVWRVLTLALIDFRVLRGGRHGLAAFYAFDDNHRIPPSTSFAYEQLL